VGIPSVCEFCRLHDKGKSSNDHLVRQFVINMDKVCLHTEQTYVKNISELIRHLASSRNGIAFEG